MNKLHILLIGLFIFAGCNYEQIKPITKTPSMTPPEVVDTIVDSVKAPIPLPINKNISLLALGDSYTVGQGVMQAQSYPFQLQQALQLLKYEVSQPKVIARTGWTTQDLQMAINSENILTNYDFIFLLIGVNNQYQNKAFSNYREEFKILLANAIKLANNNPKHVFVLSIPDYGFTPFGKLNKTIISKEIDQYNAENWSQSLASGVNYINITDISRSNLQNLVASDNLHPSANQYALWVERIMPVLRPYLP